MRYTTGFISASGLIRSAITIGVVVLALASANCAGSASEESVGDPAQGRDLYEGACAWCHGLDLRGTERGPAHLSEIYGPDRTTDDVFRNAIVNGVPQKNWDFGAMAAISSLSETDITNIIAFIRDTQLSEGLIPLNGAGSP